MKKKNTTLGSEPSKRVFGNTPEHPDNIRPGGEGDHADPTPGGAKQGNMKKQYPTRKKNGELK
ncbi:MAG: hypothetical protein JO301_05760 [Chitinophagaceae bacterium]|nr:hypothetical protein [Chitinophagaceae bacterium]